MLDKLEMPALLSIMNDMRLHNGYVRGAIALFNSIDYERVLNNYIVDGMDIYFSDKDLFRTIRHTRILSSAVEIDDNIFEMKYTSSEDNSTVKTFVLRIHFADVIPTTDMNAELYAERMDWTKDEAVAYGVTGEYSNLFPLSRDL